MTSVSADRFADDYWSHKPLLSRAEELGQDFGDLFSLAAVDELVADRAIRTPFVRMADEGKLLDVSRYTSSGGFGAEIGDQLDSGKVLQEFAAGATLVLQALHRTWRPIADFTRDLVADLAHPAQVNAYVTPASSRGFDPHYDVHDVFVIQIHGEKHWKIHPPVHENPLRSQPWTDHSEAVARQAEGTPAIDETFRPGDVLYLPRGWIHSATALGGTSIHLTIGVSALNRWDVVQQLVAQSASDPALRSSLPLGFDATDAAALESLVQETVDALADQLRSSAERPDPIGDRLTRTLRDFTQPEPVSPISTVEALASLDDSAIVSWRQGLVRRIDESENQVHIVLAKRTVSLPGEAAAAVRSLASGEPTAATALVDLDADSSLVVARRLLREGILVLR
ncbi:cupin domain-containing protein [Glaciihabitans sp. UYNi722]|uniref:cupin domain-containing protein n=1 Tax=Glaciihabitans sp. UYNi722 TaxID=3156344 RepID=UPI00339B98FC